ncbi:hypothetical protein RIF25_09270 [Thermosynechococcaceae cyanobacterium BACA0444]|uniref:Uncharacterized protein n=1 Tax=Pseudocalidococcus azoricus BACA0444 TaxID=2918990 RepID=A0AAE4JXC1_9CYAN|nr:hypothetical protein [Pseudocalidococcus azoricus]MDS3860998.1 hypothetical protein [Pseudocalidococcus azoricus BACA0444]
MYACLDPWVVLPSEADYWHKWLSRLWMPDRTPYWQTDIGREILTYRRYVIAEFIRTEIEGIMKSYPLPRCRENNEFSRPMVLGECELWLALKKVLVEMHSEGYLPKIDGLKSESERVPAWMSYLVLEHQLVMFLVVNTNETATRVMKHQQNINRSLIAIQSVPFSACCTKIFITQSQSLANLNYNFQKKYNDMVRARMALTQILVKSKATLTKITPK